MAERYLHDYIQVNIGSLDLAANHRIKQIVDVIADRDKDRKCVLQTRFHWSICERWLTFVCVFVQAGSPAVGADAAGRGQAACVHRDQEEV